MKILVLSDVRIEQNFCRNPLHLRPPLWSRHPISVQDFWRAYFQLYHLICLNIFVHAGTPERIFSRAGSYSCSKAFKMGTLALLPGFRKSGEIHSLSGLPFPGVPSLSTSFLQFELKWCIFRISAICNQLSSLFSNRTYSAPIRAVGGSNLPNKLQRGGGAEKT